MLYTYPVTSPNQTPYMVPAPEFNRVEAVFEQGSGNCNEDAQLLSAGLYGVFDGATSLSGACYEGLTGGYLAATIAAKSFSERQYELSHRLVVANKIISRQMKVAGVDFSRKEEHWSTSLAVIEMAGDSFNWCQLGDCRIQLIYHDGSSRQLIEPVDHDSETLALWQNIGPNSDQAIGTALAEQILRVRRRMNIDFGVLNGEPEALDFVATGTESLDDVAAIILHTDGLTLPNYEQNLSHDQDLLATIYHQQGLAAVRDRVRSLQENDPGCFLYPRFKIHDDISAIAIS